MPAGIYVRTKEMRKIISERVKRRKHWKNSGFKETNIETHNAPEYKRKQSLIVKTLWQNPEYRKKHSEGVKKCWQNPEYRKKQMEGHTSESKLKKSESMKKYWQKPESKKNNTIKSLSILNIWAKAVKVRAGYKCEYCGSRDYLISHHIFSIRHSNTKWDIDNGICLCVGHHIFKKFSAHGSPEFILWIIKYIGQERYERIRLKANQIKKWTELEKWEIYWGLKKYIKEG